MARKMMRRNGCMGSDSDSDDDHRRNRKDRAADMPPLQPFEYYWGNVNDTTMGMSREEFEMGWREHDKDGSAHEIMNTHHYFDLNHDNYLDEGEFRHFYDMMQEE